MPVPYVPVGRDATVDYDRVDFKFRNNFDTPIAI
jgi:vancomycin resistance protein YoaR